MSGARVARRGRVLTQARAPQRNGNTPLLMAANEGFTEVVKLLLEAGLDKDARNKVSEGRIGGGVGHAYGACVSFWGSHPGCWLSAC